LQFVSVPWVHPVSPYWTSDVSTAFVRQLEKVVEEEGQAANSTMRPEDPLVDENVVIEQAAIRVIVPGLTVGKVPLDGNFGQEGFEGGLGATDRTVWMAPSMTASAEYSRFRSVWS
jgi:hypothetical protein